MNLTETFQKVVFLLGAGASSDANCKLSSGMLESLNASISNLSTSNVEFEKYKDDFGEIYHFILASLHYQSTMSNASFGQSPYLNIEDFVMLLRQLIDKEFVIPYPLIGNWNDKILKWELRNEDIFTKFKDFITRQLVEDWTRFDRDLALATLAPIREMLNTAEALKLNIFTLNYDLVFEEVFNSQTQKIVDTGFSERELSNSRVQYWTADFNNELSPTKINLYKLHGSVDWEYNLGSEDIAIKEKIDDGREPLIIFGSPSKMLSFDPFLYMLSEFRSVLQKATMFVVVGYSFHDKYINNLLIQQLSQNTYEDVPKKLLIVSPACAGKTEIQFADELKAIQDSKSINDVINFKLIPPDRIKLIPRKAAEFYLEYFSNGAQGLKNELEQTEQGGVLFD